MIADIIINTTAKQLQQTFSYLIPEGLNITVGSRVLIPFGYRKEEGIVICIREANERDFSFSLKSILEVLSQQSGFQEEMVQTALWIHSYYLCTMADAFRLFMVEKKGITRQSYLVVNTDITDLDVHDQKIVQSISSSMCSYEKAISIFGKPTIERLINQHIIRVRATIKNNIVDKQETIVQWVHADNEGILVRRPRQKALLAYMEQHKECTLEQLSQDGFQRQLVFALSQTGCIGISKRLKKSNSAEGMSSFYSPWKLTSEQVSAIHTVRQDIEGKTYVLHGVTGSGKTEVYIQLAADVLAKAKQVLVLVPEIALTGQMVQRFLARFGDEVVIMHSKLSKGERKEAWMRMKEGLAHICIGARSAVFTGVQQLGLVIIDECHDTSYKQDEAPRYHAVKVAQKRAAYYGCPVVLGSATPLITDYYQSLQGKYTLLSLSQRVSGRNLPSVCVVDMRSELDMGNYSVLSYTLMDKLKKALAAHEQAIILLNRRGFSTFVMCRKCGFVVMCQTCEVPMVYHKDNEVLRCHYCEATSPIPQCCPQCNSKYIKFFGSGTEKIEMELHELFPTARVMRLDQDTTVCKHQGENILAAFGRGEADILLGTQMVAKGHDFPNVTVVGILAADSLLNVPAYWAGERTFQLLTQAAGRAGRGDKPGIVVMQTYAPEHYVIENAKKQDYLSFYKQEIEYRKAFLYPPFHDMIKILVQDQQESRVWQKANALAQQLQPIVNQQKETELIGPFVDIIKKIRNKYRVVLLIKGKDLQEIKDYIRTQNILQQQGVLIDVDPL